ncbi:hypothetical protein BD410DRAFT_903185 [Rickenella mellea]|uniref:F-box domain-containing protein n=1 Tax=Rickenella mellea TaxID=50990 RepID=A0A4Y7PEY3_9AGAM|nr:hypothetical protein BD410DRAFT_903185 [Rickenella mellea]
MDETAKKAAVLLEHLYRVQDLEIRASSREDMELCWYHLKKSAPQLVTCQIFLDDETTEYELPSEYLGAASALQSLSLRNVVMVWNFPNLHNLSTLSLQFNANDISVSSIVEMLQQSPMLESLTIGSPYLANDEFPDSTIALCHLRRVDLKICNIRAFESLLSVLDLPMDVHCTLLLHPDAFYNQRQQYTLPLPRHLTSASVCRKLECYFAFGRVKVEASVSPNAESHSTSRVSIRMGPVPHIDDDESKWLSHSFKGGNMFLHDLAGIVHLADIVSTRSFFADTLLLDLSWRLFEQSQFPLAMALHCLYPGI